MTAANSHRIADAAAATAAPSPDATTAPGRSLLDGLEEQMEQADEEPRNDEDEHDGEERRNRLHHVERQPFESSTA